MRYNKYDLFMTSLSLNSTDTSPYFAVEQEHVHVSKGRLGVLPAKAYNVGSRTSFSLNKQVGTKMMHIGKNIESMNDLLEALVAAKGAKQGGNPDVSLSLAFSGSSFTVNSEAGRLLDSFPKTVALLDGKKSRNEIREQLTQETNNLVRKAYNKKTAGQGERIVSSQELQNANDSDSSLDLLAKVLQQTENVSKTDVSPFKKDNTSWREQLSQTRGSGAGR